MLECRPRRAMVSREVDIADLSDSDPIHRARQPADGYVVPAHQHPAGLEPKRIGGDGGTGGADAGQEMPAADLQVDCSIASSASRLS